jgi:nitrogen-specific signal transduction histidine kinase
VAFCSQETEAAWQPSGVVDPRSARRFAHAIRNPLNGAKLHLALLERQLDVLRAGPDAYGSLRWIEAQIDRVASLVAQYESEATRVKEK